MFLCDKQSLEILNVFNSLTSKQIVWTTGTFFKKLECLFLVESTKNKKATFSYKLPSQKYYVEDFT